MINNQYSMSTEDLIEFKDMKKSPMYRDYINSITSSPIMMTIISEHIKNVDCKEDIENLKNKTSTALNTIFKKSMKSMAVRIVADTLVLKEIIDVGIEDVKVDIDSNFKIKYLMGLADNKYYKRAYKIIENEPDTDSILYKGYVSFLQRETNDNSITKINPFDKINDIEKKKKFKPKKKEINLNANDIQL